MSDTRNTAEKIADAILGKKAPPTVNPTAKYVNAKMPENYKASELEEARRKTAGSTIGVRG